MNREKKFLILILLLAVSLRVYALNTGLPHLTHSDENLIFDLVMHTGQNLITYHRPIPQSYYHEGIWLAYPTFHIYLIVIIFGILYLLNLWSISSLEIATRTLAPREITLLYISGRMISVITGVATVYVVYLIGKNLFSKRTALISAFFLSITMLHVIHAHWFTLDIHNTFWLVLSFYLASIILNKDDRKYYIYGGITLGLASGTKYNGIPMFLVFLFAHLLRTKNIKRIFDKNIAYAFGVMCAVFVITTPYSLISFNDFIYWLTYQNLQLSTKGFWPFWPNEIPTWAYHIKVSLNYALGWPLLIISMGGVIYSIVKHKKEDLLLLSWIFLYYSIISSWDVRFIRYVILLLPFLVIFGSRLLDDLLVLSKKTKVHYLILLLIVCISFYTLFHTLLYLNVLGQEDTRTTASRWMSENIDENSKIVVFKGWGHWSNPKINNSLFNVEERNYFNDISDSIQKKEGDYVILSSVNYRYFLHNPNVYSTESNFFDNLLSGNNEYTIIKRFEKNPNFLGYEVHDKNPPVGITEFMPTILILKKNVRY